MKLTIYIFIPTILICPFNYEFEIIDADFAKVYFYLSILIFFYMFFFYMFSLICPNYKKDNSYYVNLFVGGLYSLSLSFMFYNVDRMFLLG